jgi:alpha-glucosidase
MKNILHYLALAVLVCCMGLQAQGKEQRFTLKSPDGKLVTHIVATEKDEITYDIVYNGVTVMLPSHLGLNRAYEKGVVSSMAVSKSSTATIDEEIASPFTRQATMRNRCNELTLSVGKDLDVIFRAYNEGIAYRYQIYQPCKVRFEKVEYNFAGDYEATVPYVTNFDENNHDAQYTSSFENLYTKLLLSKLDTRRLCFLPLLVHGPHGVKVCLTESTLTDYPGLYLKAMGANKPESLPGYRLEGENARYPKTLEQGGHNNLQMIVKEREEYIAEVNKETVMPWRIAMVAKNSTELAMNNMSYLLGEPCKVADLSWIKPGKVAWDWWNNWNIGGVPFKAGINNDTYKYYIDFASKNGIEYVILDEGWAVNKQADLFQVVPEIDLPMLVQYAKERNVGLILWAGYYAFDRDMEHVCQHYSEMGIKGFKVDFMDRDDQIVTQFYKRAAAMCAKYHLLVDFHGAFKPAGLNRTYPNVLNFEGVAGLEQLKWAPATWDQVQYDTEIPFIRQTAGPMDYTQGAMHNAAKGCYHPCWSEPMSQGTRCHQLALYIVLESPLNMLCDSPTNYEKEPDYTRFVAEIPTVWDETRVLQGEVGEYIVTARRKGDVWYIGGITNWTERDIAIDLSEIGLRNAVGTMYVDGTNAHRKGSDYDVLGVKGFSQLKVHLAPGGGFVARVGGY